MTRFKPDTYDKINNLKNNCYGIGVILTHVHLSNDEVIRLSSNLSLREDMLLKGFHFLGGYVTLIEEPKFASTKLSKLMHPNYIEEDDYLTKYYSYNEIKENLLKGICLDLDTCDDIIRDIVLKGNLK